jgi:hypothetical protein
LPAKVPRKNPVPQREREIAQRLLQFRQSTRLTRAALAWEIQIPAHRLKSYEGGDVPLPYDVAKKLVSSFSLNLEWLAEGRGEMYDLILIRPDLESELRRGALFSEVFDALYKPALSGTLQKWQVCPESLKEKKGESQARKTNVEPVHVVGVHTAGSAQVMLGKLISVTLAQLPPHLVWSYYRALMGASHEFESSHAEEIGSWGAVKGPPGELQKDPVQKQVLTEVGSNANIAPMKSHIAALLKQVKSATAYKGGRTDLAGFLDVPLATVSRWLSKDAFRPSGEMALRMKAWVENPVKLKRKQKSPGSATNTARAETQPKPKNAKPKSGPS